MHRYMTALAATAVLITATSAARAQNNWYISGSAGGDFFSDRTAPTTFYNSSGATASGTHTTSFDPGYALTGSLGYHLPMGFRVEAELGYIHNSVDSTTPHVSAPAFAPINGTKFTSPTGGDYDRVTATVNMFYDLPIHVAGVTPYVGAGAGYYHLSSSDAHFTVPFGFTGRGGDVSNAVILAEAGATIPLTGTLSLVPAYRYEHFFQDGGGVDSNLVKLGLRSDF
jgi:hypothetical protein